MKTEMIRVYGIVQGVGFRPFVSREASDLGLCGTVANKGSYVEIHAQGSEKAVGELKNALENRPPERARKKGIFSYPLTSLCAKNVRRSFSTKQTEDISTLL